MSHYVAAKKFLSPAIILAGVVFGVFTVIAGVQAIVVVKYHRSLMSEKQMVREMEKTVEELAYVNREAQLLQENYDQLQSRVVKHNDYGLLLELLSAQANHAGVRIIAMEPQPLASGPESAYQVLPIFIDALCGYHQLGDFLLRIEQAHPLMRVETIKIQAGTGQEAHAVFLRVGAVCAAT